MKELYDGDVLVYRIGFACEKKNYAVESNSPEGTKFFDNKRDANTWIKELEQDGREYALWTEHIVEPLSHVLHSLNLTIGAIHDRLQGSERRFYLSGQGNFRERFATVRGYKANRDKAHKPVHYEAIRRYLCDRYSAIVVDGMEADDALGIEATKDPKNSVIITNDKDLRQIEGWHYDWTRDTDGNFRRPEWVDEWSGTKYFYSQLATGDATDNVPGIEGLGEAGARRLLQGVIDGCDAESRVYGAYIKKYGREEGEKRFLETGTLIRICKKEEDINTMWKPLQELNSLALSKEKLQGN